MVETCDMHRLVQAIKRHSGLSVEEIIQAGENGADSGWSGFAYYSDTTEFYNNNEERIWDLLESTASDLGQKPLALVADFRTEVHDVMDFKNVLSWFALEEAGRWLKDHKDDDKNWEDND